MYYRDGNHHETHRKAFSQQVLTKWDLSDSIRTIFGLCRKKAKVAEYATDIEVTMK